MPKIRKCAGLEKLLFPCMHVRISLQFDKISLEYGIFPFYVCIYFFQSKSQNFLLRSFLTCILFSKPAKFEIHVLFYRIK